MVKTEKKTVNVADLKEFEKNPNKHSQQQIECLAKSIEKYSQYYPIVTDENLMILAGHGKKKALEFLGRDTADIIILKGLSEKEKKKIILEDNKIQDMSFADYSMIESLIKEIGETDIIGFDTDYLEAMISNHAEIDNEGVNLNSPTVFESNQKQVEKIPEEKKEQQEEQLQQFEEAISKPNVLICPHCGKEIVM